MSDWGPWERTEGLDDFAPRHGLVNQRVGCTFCGSMPPDEFLDLIEQGYEVGPTDKRYKAYLHAPANELRANGGAVGKFYYQHLDEQQRARFIGLLNSGRMKVGYPGHFYVLPFFVRRAEEPDS